MKRTIEEKITVAKLPNNTFIFMCLKCNTTIDEYWEFCPQCGDVLNVGLQ